MIFGTNRKRLGAHAATTMAALSLIGMAVPSSAALAESEPPPPSAPAPPPRPIQFEVPVRSVISVEDTLLQNRYYEDYIVTLAKDDVIRVDMEADPQAPMLPAQTRPLDTYLELLPEGHDSVARNDDIDGSYNSRIVYTAPQSGNYIIRAQGFFRNVGGFVLTVRKLVSTARIQQLSESQVGDLRDGSPAGTESGQAFRYDEYTLGGTVGERVLLMLNVEDANAQLSLKRADGTTLAESSGIGGYVNASIVVELPATETYTVRVRAPLTEGRPVHYALNYSHGPRPGQIPAEPLVLDRPDTDSLTLGSAAEMVSRDSRQIGFLYRLYRLAVRRDQPITVTLVSNTTGLDPVLEAGIMSPAGFAIADSNDDTDGLNSRLVLRPSQDGEILLRARGLGVALGSFTIRATPGEPPPPVPQARQARP